MSALSLPFTEPSDPGAIEARQRIAWFNGSYAVVGTTLQLVGEQLCEALDLRAGSRVLDVAAGNGNASLAAARRWCEVTSTDYLGSLLESGRARAQAEGHEIAFQAADAENLPFADGSFDTVLSAFGVTFSPNHARAASELARVCRPGGRIGLACWTPEGFIGQVFKLIDRFVPPTAGSGSPALWGTKARLEALFDGAAESIRVTSREFVFRYRSPSHWLSIFRTFYGPLCQAFAALDPGGQARLTRDLLALVDRHNRSGDRTLVLPGEYLEVVVERRGAGPAGRRERRLRAIERVSDTTPTGPEGQ